MTHIERDVVIVGAGIAGLGLACALAPYRLSVALVEKRKATGGIHRGDSLLPKATALLARWGVLDDIVAAGAEPIGHLEMHDADSLLFTTELTSDDDPHPYLVLPHARIEQVLLDAARRTGNVALIRPARVIDLLRDQTGHVRGVLLRKADGDVEVRGRLVVACDGQKSIVVRQLGVERTHLQYDHAYLGLEADRPASYDNAMRVHLHEEGGVLLMPRPDRVGIGVLVDAYSSAAWMHMTDRELSDALVARAPILEGMALHRRGAHVYALTRTHVTRYVDSGAVIIGDAAHTTNPTAGQGMAMALTDAGALADVVGPALADGRPLKPALETFSAERWAANDPIVRSSHLLALAYGLRGRAWTSAKTALLKTVGSRLGSAVATPIISRFLRSPSRRAGDAAQWVA